MPYSRRLLSSLICFGTCVWCGGGFSRLFASGLGDLFEDSHGLDFCIILGLSGVALCGVPGERLEFVLLATLEPFSDFILLHNDSGADYFADIIESVVGSHEYGPDLSLRVLRRVNEAVLYLPLPELVDESVGLFFAEDNAFFGGTFHCPVDTGVQQQLGDLVLEDDVLVALYCFIVLDCDLFSAFSVPNTALLAGL